MNPKRHGKSKLSDKRHPQLHEQLEERVLFDAVLGDSLENLREAAVDPFTPSADLSDNAETTQADQSPQKSRNEIIVIDKNVHGYQLLVTEILLTNDADVVFLDPFEDGIQQFASTLEGRTEIDAIHLISHGEAGSLWLGNATLNLESMQKVYVDELAMIRSAFSEDGNILIYGCNFAKGRIGTEAADLLAHLTEVGVAASDDTTGHASLGGDWELEYETGLVETRVIQTESFEGLLTPSNISGVIFEDINYGGGAGRDRTNSSGFGRGSVIVELYDASGTYIKSTVTDDGTGLLGVPGAYEFTNLTDGDYYIRVVSDTVTSSRTGSNGSELGVQTYRVEETNGSNVVREAITNEVGGRTPVDADAGAHTGDVASLNTTTFIFSGGLLDGKKADSVSMVQVSGSDVLNIDFGFNFDTIVNTNNAGQGSLRQFILNSNLLDNTGLDQDLAVALDGNYAIGDEVSIFMIPMNNINGTGANAGAAIITLANNLPDITDSNTAIDGRTQSENIGNTNSGTLGIGGTVGVDSIVLDTVERTEIVIDLELAKYLRFTGQNGAVRGLTIYDSLSTNGEDGKITSVKNADGLRVEHNVIGSYADGSLPTSSDLDVINAVRALGQVEIRNNYFAFNGLYHIYLGAGNSSNHSANGSIISNNEMQDARMAVLHADAIALYADDVSFTGNLISGVSQGSYTGIDGGGKGIELWYGATNFTIDNNTISDAINTGIGISGGAGNGIVSKNIIDNNADGGIFVKGGGTGIQIVSNEITNNTGDGIEVSNVITNATILTNVIHSNTELGIDLKNDGITTNDSGDSDSGPNNLLNYPVVALLLTDGTTTVNYELTLDAPVGFYRIEFFSNSAADPSGFGEGEVFLGAITIDTSGGTTFTGSFTAAVAVSPGDIITTTATEDTSAGAGITFGSTSEFSAASIANSAPTAIADSHTVVPGVTVNIDPRANDSDSEGNPLSITQIEDPLNQGVPILLAVNTPVVLISGVTVELQPDGTLSVKIPNGVTDTETFNYTIDDGNGGAASATISLNRDTDADGVANIADLDDDNDGILDIVENPSGTIDSDNDGIFNHLDIDSDNDGITDNVESQTTVGYIAPSGTGSSITDSDKDGLDDNYDSNTFDATASASIGLIPVDTDSTLGSTDGIADYLDTDSDNDGLSDTDEAGHGINQTAIDASVDLDFDGLKDAVEGADTSDGFDVNDENLDVIDTNFNLIDTDKDTAANGSDAVTLVNDWDYRDLPNAPRIDLNSTAAPTDSNVDHTVTFTEGLGPVTVTSTDGDLNDFFEKDVTSVILVVDPLNINDGAAEEITIAGQLFNLGIDSNGAAFVVGGTSFDVAYMAVAGTFTISNNTGASNPIDEADIDLLIRGITYENTSQDPTAGTRTLSFTATDSGGLISNTATSTITVVPVNDPPVAENNVGAVTEDTGTLATGNVITDNDPTDGLDSDAEGDTLTVTDVDGSTISTTTTVIAGTFGSLTIDPNGTYTYALDNSNPTVQAQGDTDSLTDTFTYTVSDGSLTDTANLVITIHGADDPITIAGLNDGPDLGTTDATVQESDLSGGSNAAGTSEATTGSFTISAPDDLTSLTVGGTVIGAVALDASDTTPVIIVTSLGQIRIDGFDPVTGVVDYTYTLTSAADQSGGNVTNDIPLIVTDGDGDTQSGTLSIFITDDTPTANADNNSVTEDSGTPATGTVTTNDTPGADGFATIPVTGVVAGVAVPVAGNIGNAIAGTFGTLTLNSNGTYSYTVDNTNPTVNALQTTDPALNDLFTYEVTDADGSVSTATLTIAISGANDPPVIDLDTNDSSGATGGDYTGTFVEGGASVNVADTDTMVNDFGEQDIRSLTILVGGVLEGANEVVTIAGRTFVLNTNLTESGVTVGGVSVDIAYSSVTSTFTVANSTGATNPIDQTDLVTLVNGITYQNRSVAPTIGDRTLTFTVTDLQSLDSNIATSTITVVQASASVQWSLTGDGTVTEGSDATYMVSLDNPLLKSGETATVDLSLVDNLTNATDHSTLNTAVSTAVTAYNSSGNPGSLNWNGTTLTFTSDGSGTMAPLMINLSTTTDNLSEGPEDFTISLTKPGSTTGELVSLDAANSIVATTITDANPSMVSVTANDPTGSESGPDNGQFTLSLSSPSSSDTTINYTISGSAIGGTDYNNSLITGTITIPAGTTNITIDVPVLDDHLAEPNESVVLTLSGITAGHSGISIDPTNNKATVTILDNDLKHEWSLSGPTVADEGSTLQYSISLTEPFSAGEAVSVEIGITDLETASTDYGDVIAAIQMAADSHPGIMFDGVRRLTYTAPNDGTVMPNFIVDLPIVDDTMLEGSESFRIQLTNPTSLTSTPITISTSEVTTTINDDSDGIGNGEDGPARWSLSGVPNIDEGDSASYTVRLDGTYQAGEIVSVELNLNNLGTNAADYGDTLAVIQAAADANPDVVFDGISKLTYTSPSDGASMTDLSLQLPIDADGLDETQESIALTLSNPSSSSGLTVSLGTANVTTTITGPPVATDDINSTTTGSPATGNVLANDSDPDSETLTVKTTPVVAPSNGSLTLNSDGSYEYIPNPGFSGTDSFTYEVCDSNGNCDTGTLTVHITGIGSSLEFGSIAEAGENFEVPITILIGNLGSNDFDNLSLIEDLQGQFGSAFVSATIPTVSAVDSFGGTLPGINSNWVTDTTQNVFDNTGLLASGDRIAITLNVIVNPDASGSSTFLSNQVHVTAGIAGVPTITIEDLSDSGLDTAGTNPGEPGDTGGSDDPTPLLIGDAGLAKQVLNVARDADGFQLTIEFTLENTGTTVLDNLQLHDDLKQQFGDQFDSLLEAPQIVSSSASVNPNLNSNYLSDTSQNIFDGVSGKLQLGESITVRLVVKVTLSETDGAELVNQATGGGRPLNPDGTPLTNPDGSLVSSVMDLSDSGSDPNGSNPGAPGDTGDYNDATSTTLPFFTWDSFHNFSKETFGESSSKGIEEEPFGVWPVEHTLLSQKIMTLAPEPIYSGSARPGTQIIARIYGSSGQLLAEATSFADVGGNWIMQMHDVKPGDHHRVEFVELVGQGDLFSSYGDIYGYLGSSKHSNDYSAMQPMTGYGEHYSVGSIFRLSSEQSLAMSHQMNSTPLGFGT